MTRFPGRLRETGVWIAHNYVTRFVMATGRGLIRLNLTLALMLYVMIGYAGRTPGLAADDTASAELRGFARERKTAVLRQASAAVAGLLLPAIAGRPWGMDFGRHVHPRELDR
jgi:hypothetical protein